MTKIGCLVIHGFGGNATEVEPLVSRLAEQGFQVAAPSLKGHTGRRQDLKNIRYTQWIDSVEPDLSALQSSCEKVYLIGFSMGGLIAVHLGSKYQVRGIVTLNTPVYYWNIRQILTNIASDLTTRDFKNSRRYWKSSRQLPGSALLNFILLLNKTKSKLREIDCPIFVAQAIHDDAVRKESADYIYGHVVSRIKQIKFYDCPDHLILWSSVADTVINDTIEFLRSSITKL